jgi:di/tricarboxylate transporter
MTAFLCFLAVIALGAAPPEVIFSGFAASGIWLLIAGLIIGAAITGTGLGQQIATRIFERTGASYARSVGVLALAGVALGLLVPSTIPRVIILMPVAMSLAGAMGFEPGSRGQIGLAITAATSTLLPTYAILTANLPTIIHYGALETLYGIEPSYMAYFIAQLPTNLVRFALLLVLLVPFAKAGSTQGALATTDAPTPMTTAQKRLLGVLVIAIGFWATDTLHGISPAWIALGAATFVLWPEMGLLHKDAMKTNVDMSPVFFLAGVFALSAVAQHIGLDRIVANTLVPKLALEAGSDLYDLYAIAGFSGLISHLTTAPAAPIVLAPLAGPIAETTGWPVLTVAMAQIIGISTPILPYQAPPLIVAMALAHIPVKSLTRLCFALAVGTLLLGVPLTYLWWTLLGLM